MKEKRPLTVGHRDRTKDLQQAGIEGMRKVKSLTCRILIECSDRLLGIVLIGYDGRMGVKMAIVTGEDA